MHELDYIEENGASASIEENHHLKDGKHLDYRIHLYIPVTNNKTINVLPSLLHDVFEAALKVEAKGGLVWSMGRFWVNLKHHYRRWKEQRTKKAYYKFVKLIQDDSVYAHKVMCNICMPIFYGTNGKLTISEAQIIAEDLMDHMFHVKKCEGLMPGR
jgi:hypothetical protein